MTAASYSPPVDDQQRTRLLDAHAAVAAAEDHERAARAHRNNTVLDLARDGIGATAITRTLNDGDHPWRTVHRVSVARWITDAAAGPGGAGKPRGATPTPEQAARLRAAQQALYEAGVAVVNAHEARGATFVALHGEGVPATEQAATLDVDRKLVQTQVSAARRDPHRRGGRARA